MSHNSSFNLPDFYFLRVSENSNFMPLSSSVTELKKLIISILNLDSVLNEELSIHRTDSVKAVPAAA